MSLKKFLATLKHLCTVFKNVIAFEDLNDFEAFKKTLKN